MGCLKKVLNFISDNLEWDFDNMPTTVANLQKHPGVPMAAGKIHKYKKDRG